MQQHQQQHQKAADVVVYVGTNKAGRHSPSSTMMIIMLWLVLLIYCDIKTFCFLYCSAAIIEVTPEHLPKGVHTYVYLLLLSTFHISILTLLIRTFRSCSLLLLLVIRCALKIQVIIPGTPRHDNEVPVETLQYVCCALFHCWSCKSSKVESGLKGWLLSCC